MGGGGPFLQFICIYICILYPALARLESDILFHFHFDYFGNALPTKLGPVELDLYAKSSILTRDTTRGYRRVEMLRRSEVDRSMCDNTLGTRMAAEGGFCENGSAELPNWIPFFFDLCVMLG